ncbi:MMPL family transporter [Nocardia pseudobrasiliensis]|uniref:MMPL family transporter n=1 Tax=Nocardia pseudobrasiliensis TaxID=45979 RepID=UPI001471A761|nr:MMPL family transporter [Nocardia pseudobrasiliensis]
MGRVGGWCYDHRRAVLVGWILAVLAVIAVSIGFGSSFRNDYGGDGESAQAQAVLRHAFSAQAGDSAQLVFHSSDPVTGHSDRITQALNTIRPLPAVTSVSEPVPARNGRTVFATIQFDALAVDLSKADVQRVIDTAESFGDPNLQVELGGPPISAVVKPGPGASEGIGITAAIVIMLVAFGSVIAMGLPILTALMGIGAGFGVVALLSHLLIEPTFGPEMMAMIGLGVGIDYALFVVTRYRQGLGEGLEPRDAVVLALATAGQSVLFAGTTVLISLCGLFLVGQEYLAGLALGTIVGVLAVMAAALTLLPAVLGFVGRNVDRWHLPMPRRSGTAVRATGGMWWRWSRTVQKRPLLCGAIALAILVTLTSPLFTMRLAFGDAGNDPVDLTTRRAYDLLSEAFGPGFNGPLVVAAELPGGVRDRATIDAVEAVLSREPGVARVTPPEYNQPAGNAAVMLVYPTTEPQAAATATLVKRLRDTVFPQATAGTEVKLLIGGKTAAGIDGSTYLARRLPWVIGLVIALSSALLMVVFRSIVIPVKAAVMNLLSIGVGYGAMVAVYQWGWLATVFNVSRPGPVDPWIPLMMFTIAFGLSMDYEVFLLSRIREQWRRHGDNSTAVADGIAVSGRVITAAAAIMVCVFGSFVIGDPLRVLDILGLGLAVAILIDATIIRMVLVPAVMQVLGNANWWLPGWLARVLPSLSEDEPTQTVSVVNTHAAVQRQ